jgi:hypothetical protein
MQKALHTKVGFTTSMAPTRRRILCKNPTHPVLLALRKLATDRLNAQRFCGVMGVTFVP